MNHLHSSRTSGAILILAFSLIACAPAEEATTLETETAPTPDTLTAEMPGFLDPAPPGPTSDTTVLSGGTIVAGEVINDAVLVLTNGKLVAYGARGSVDIPNDSIGVDMRGKWIAPGVANADGSLTLNEMPSIQPSVEAGADQMAAFLIFSAPVNDQPEVSNLVGVYANGELELNESD